MKDPRATIKFKIYKIYKSNLKFIKGNDTDKMLSLCFYP